MEDHQADGQKSSEETRVPFEVSAGDEISHVVRAMVAKANESGQTIEAKFNDQPVVVKPGDNAVEITAAFIVETERRGVAYRNSDEYKRRKAEQEQQGRVRQEMLRARLTVAPPRPAITDEALWQSWVDANADPYGSAVMRYAETWARVMESFIIHNGDSVAGCAEQASHIADTEGITGFMYGAAVAMLSKAWRYGEELRRWHNIDTQVSNEGERANETGGVLNPALLTILNDRQRA